MSPRQEPDILHTPAVVFRRYQHSNFMYKETHQQQNHIAGGPRNSCDNSLFTDHVLCASTMPFLPIMSLSFPSNTFNVVRLYPFHRDREGVQTSSVNRAGHRTHSGAAEEHVSYKPTPKRCSFHCSKKLCVLIMATGNYWMSLCTRHCFKPFVCRIY